MNSVKKNHRFHQLWRTILDCIFMTAFLTMSILGLIAIGF